MAFCPYISIAVVSDVPQTYCGLCSRNKFCNSLLKKKGTVKEMELTWCCTGLLCQVGDVSEGINETHSLHLFVIPYHHSMSVDADNKKLLYSQYWLLIKAFSNAIKCWLFTLFCGSCDFCHFFIHSKADWFVFSFVTSYWPN